jgi:type 1 glutamine amidotransferase
MSGPRVLLISGGLLHPSAGSRRVLRSIITCHLGAAPECAASLEAAAAGSLEPYDAVVLYYHRGGARLPRRVIEEFETWVARGGGVLAVHSATASYKSEERYFGILGGRFTGHGPVMPFALTPSPGTENPFRDIGRFELTDELYTHDFAGNADVRMTAGCEGRDIPAVWTRLHGRGRVCCISPGHRRATMKLPGMRALLETGLDWVCQR